jgi:hypothetical protein
MNAYGTATQYPLSIASREGEGALWFTRKVLISPRFEIRARVEIGTGGCRDRGSWAMDGFTVIISKSVNYLSSGGGFLGYYNIYDAIVTEVDLWHNSNFNDISYNSMSIHSCIGSHCSPYENGSTIQRNLPFNYSNCGYMIYDVVIMITQNNFRVQIGDYYIVEYKEDLWRWNDNWAYVGLTGFFRGNRRSLSLVSSGICEDDFNINNFQRNWLVGSSYLNSASPVMTAGQTLKLMISFYDVANLQMPHTLGLNIMDWTLNVGSSCGTPVAFYSVGALWLETTISGCTTAGDQYVLVATSKGNAPNFNFKVQPSGFERLTLCGFKDNETIAETAGTRLVGNEIYFNWGNLNGDFTFDKMVANGGALDFFVCSTDRYGNEYKFGTDSAKATSTFGFTVSSLGRSIVPKITAVTDSRYKVTIPTTQSGVYAIRSSYLRTDDGKTRYMFSALPSNVETSKSSFCNIGGYSVTPVLDANVVISMTCYLKDPYGNIFFATLAENSFKMTFGAQLKNTDTNTVLGNLTLSKVNDQITFTYTTAKNGKFTISPYYDVGGARTYMTSNFDKFEVVLTPKDIKAARFWNMKTSSFVDFNPTTGFVSLEYNTSSGYLTYLDMKAPDSTYYSSFKYPDSWSTTVPITGVIYNSHTPSSRAPLKFSIVKLNSLPYILVTMDNQDDFIRRTSYNYYLELSFNGVVIQLRVAYLTSLFYGKTACPLPLHIPNTLFTANTLPSGSIVVNKENTIGSIMLATTDKELYNYKLPSTSKFTTTIVPNTGTLSISEDLILGFYNVKIFTTVAGSYSISVMIDNTTVLNNFSLVIDPLSIASKLENSSLNDVDSTKTTSTNVVFKDPIINDSTPTFYFNIYDEFKNILSWNPSTKSNLGLNVSAYVNKNAITYNINSSWTLNYDTVKNAYVISDLTKTPGEYVIIVGTANPASSISFTFSKYPGSVNTGFSSASISSNKNLMVGQTALISVSLKDSYNNNIGYTETLVKAAASKLKVFATSKDASVVNFNYADFSTNTFKFTSEAIMKQDLYVVSVTFTEPNQTAKNIVIGDNIFNVNYAKFDITKCKLSAILSKSTLMSTNSILNVNNQVDVPLFTFDFYDQNNNQLQFVDKSSKLAATFTGSNLNVNLILQWIGSNQIMWSFPTTVNLANIIKGTYSLNVLYNDLISLTYPLQFLGDGQDSDASNGDPVFDKTFFSTTEVRVTAGVNANFNIEFRTAENLRVNNYGDINLFSFSNSMGLSSTVFKVSVQMGAKKGSYIITVNSNVSSSGANPNVLIISYNKNVFNQKVNVIVKCSDLTSLVIDSNNVFDTKTKILKGVKSIESQTITFRAFDKFGNYYDDLQNNSLFSIEKIASLVNLGHSTNALLSTNVTLDALKKTFNLIITCKTIGTVTLKSTFMLDTWTYIVTPGPLFMGYTYGQGVTSSNYVAGNNFSFKVYPKDSNNNHIPKDLLSTDDYNSISIKILQPKNVSQITNLVKSISASNTVDFSFSLSEAGVNIIVPKINSTVVSCSSCAYLILVAPIVFKNSYLTLGSTKFTTTTSNQMTVGVIPSLTLTLYDTYMNVYGNIPSDFVLESKFEGNNSNVKLCNTAVDNNIIISVCQDSTNTNNWIYLVGASGYFITLTNNGVSLTYPVTLSGGSSINDASNGPLDVTKTYLDSKSLTVVAGTSIFFMIELRANDGKRKNFRYTSPNDNIKVSFSKGLANIYTSDVTYASKAGQYNVRVSSTMAFSDIDDNQIILTIEGSKCPTTVKLIVLASTPKKASFVDSKDVKYVPGKLPVGNADNQYSLNLFLYDMYSNVADASPSAFTYTLDSPDNKPVTSSIVKNGNKSFTFTINGIYAGTYTISAGLLGENYSFSILPGQPYAKNCLSKVPPSATAGDKIQVYIIPFDANNNYIQPSSLTKNDFYVSYSYKDRTSGSFVNYIPIYDFSIKAYPDNDVSVKLDAANNSTLNAFSYDVTLIYRGVNDFQVSLGTSNSLKCLNCMTTVAPGKMVFDQSSFMRYDSLSGSFLSLTTSANEDNAKTDLIYRLYPRDAYKNVIDLIDDVSLFSLTLYDKQNIPYYLKRSNPSSEKSGVFVEFVKDDKSVNNPDLTYNTLTGGAYTASFNNTLSIVNRSIILIGRPGDEIASNDAIDEQNTVINESKVAFTAGQTGYLIIELRTVNKLRKNNWNQNVTVDYRVIDSAGKDVSPTVIDKSFNSTIRNAGVLGTFYSTVSSSFSSTLLSPNKLVLKITVNGIVVNSLAPEVKVLPGPMSKANVMPQYIKTGTNYLVDGSADSPLVFKVAAYDSFANPSPCDPLSLKLSVSDPNGNIATITATRETTGFASYIIENKIAGQYTVSSDTSLLPTYYFTNKYGKLNLATSSIIILDTTIIAGAKARLKITPRDKYSNLIKTSDVLSSFTATIKTPSGKILNADITSENSDIILSKILTEKDNNIWVLNLNGVVISFAGDSFTEVLPDLPYGDNTLIVLDEKSYKNGASLSRNVKDPLSLSINLFDYFNNAIDYIPNDVIISGAIISGNNMNQITLDVTKSAENDKFVLNTPSTEISNFNHLVSGSYQLVFSMNVKGTTTAFNFVLTLVSDIDDTGYGNGSYQVEQTSLSHSTVSIPAGNIFIINMRLKTAKGLYFNNDINLDNDVKYSIGVTDTTFSFKIYKKGKEYGNYNIEITTKTATQASLVLVISIRDPQNPSSFKQLPGSVAINVKPALPSKATMLSTPGVNTSSGTQVIMTFKVSDTFGNIFTKNSEILSNFVLTNNNAAVSSAVFQLKSDGITYSVSYMPSYPPRNHVLNIFYKDSSAQSILLQKPIETYIISEVYMPNSVVVGTNLNEMQAGNKLSLSVQFYDKSNTCVDDITNIAAYATVNGPVERYDSSVVNYQYRFNVTSVGTSGGCGSSLNINVPDTQIYSTIGSYKINVYLGDNSYLAGSFTQKVIPNSLDINKFVSKFTMTGEFDSSKIKAGTSILFTIQGNDKFMNAVTSPILSDFSINLKTKDGKIARSAKDSPSSYEYSIAMAENTPGLISVSLNLIKSDVYMVQYFYKGTLISNIDILKGPLLLTVLPGDCSINNPMVNIDNFASVSTSLPTTFDIFCKDSFNNTISSGGEAFKIMLNVLVVETKTSTSVKTVLTDNNNGSYKVQFVPPLAGQYFLVIDLKGVIYYSHQFDVKDNTCPTDKPNRCPNDLTKCVANIIECIPNIEKCKSTEPFYCQVNGKDTCVISQTACDCPVGHKKCTLNNACMPVDKADKLCPFVLPVSCSKLFPNAKIFCPDGICRASLNESPSQRVCPIGSVLCPDLTCRPEISKCSSYEECPKKSMIRCSDMTCVNDQKECPSLVSCPRPGMFVCPDLSCTTSEVNCKQLPQCVSPNNILCADNSCVSDIKNCPKQVSCGHGMSLCTDIKCRTSCLQ